MPSISRSLRRLRHNIVTMLLRRRLKPIKLTFYIIVIIFICYEILKNRADKAYYNKLLSANEDKINKRKERNQQQHHNNNREREGYRDRKNKVQRPSSDFETDNLIPMQGNKFDQLNDNFIQKHPKGAIFKNLRQQNENEPLNDIEVIEQHNEHIPNNQDDPTLPRTYSPNIKKHLYQNLENSKFYNIIGLGDYSDMKKFKGPNLCPAKTLHKDTISAISRANSDNCKSEIAEVACRFHENGAYQKRRESSQNSLDNRPLKEVPLIVPDSVTNNCPVESQDFKPSNSKDSLSLNDPNLPDGLFEILKKVEMRKREETLNLLAENKPTPKENSRIDYKDLDISDLENLRKNTPTEEQVRICYLLILHGRSVRQITRMFKVIYTPQDYYILHVDARHHYLYSSLQQIFNDLNFKNVVFQTNRFTPIWGGVSLLTTIKDAIRQAIYEKNFAHWDFFINLSFADYPIAHREHLRLFLSLNKGKSFTKSHGREPEKFVQKQGLNKMFYECENRMWRLSDREIPKNLQLDGGSDWFALNRDLCLYSISDNDDGTLQEINKWFNFTLLPAESYFHTLMKTSKMCNTLVDNNLRVTNWNRARGCKCQYKHIVDWCGCSPNDFTPFDIHKVFYVKRPVFFARKFEEVVSQYPLNKVHAEVFGKDQFDLAWDSYWENYWDRDFDNKPENKEKTHKMTQLVEFSGHTLDQLISVSIFKQKDIFKGFVLNLENFDTHKDDAVRQIYLKRKDSASKAKLIKNKNDSILSKSIGDVNVGSGWDVKELIFRDFGCISNIEDNLHISVLWHDVTSEFFVTALILSPKGEVITGVDLKLAKGATVITADNIYLKQNKPAGTYTVLFFTRLNPKKTTLNTWSLDAIYNFQILETKYATGVGYEPVEDTENLMKSATLSKRNYIPSEIGEYLVKDFEIKKILEKEGVAGFVNKETESREKRQVALEALESLHKSEDMKDVNRNIIGSPNLENLGSLNTSIEPNHLLSYKWEIAGKCKVEDCDEKFWSTEFPDFKSTLDSDEMVNR